jgi:hypothetical protein
VQQVVQMTIQELHHMCRPVRERVRVLLELLFALERIVEVLPKQHRLTPPDDLRLTEHLRPRPERPRQPRLNPVQIHHDPLPNVAP